MASANGFLELDESLTYSTPPDVVMGDINYVSFKSDSPSYTPGQTVNFNIRSNNEFMILDRSYLKFSYAETTGTTGCTLSSMGAGSFISQISDTLSGLQLPVQQNANVIKAISLSNDTASRKSITTRCEFSGTYTAPGTAIATQTLGTYRTAIMPVPTTLASTTNVIPVCFLNGGWNISYLLEQYLTAYIGYSGNSYTIQNMEIVGAMLKAPDSYLGEVQKTLSAGNSLKIPLQLTKTYNNLLSTATTQTIRVQPGYLSSLNSITNVYRPTATVNAASADSFKSNITKFSEWYVNINSQRIPRNKPIKVSTDDLEWLYQELSAFNTSTSMINASTIAVNDKLHLSFKSNNSFGSGISLNDGSVALELSFNAGPVVSDILTSVLEYDALLLISQNNVSLETSF